VWPPPEDWGVEQIEHSANYGDRIAGWLTGGLNLQVRAGTGATGVARPVSDVR